MIAELDSLNRSELAAIKTWCCASSKLEDIPMLDDKLNASKEDVLAAEVSLPLACGADVSTLRRVQMRPPYSLESRQLVVDVSRLRCAVPSDFDEINRLQDLAPRLLCAPRPVPRAALVMRRSAPVLRLGSPVALQVLLSRVVAACRALEELAPAVEAARRS